MAVLQWKEVDKLEMVQSRVFKALDLSSNRMNRACLAEGRSRNSLITVCKNLHQFSPPKKAQQHPLESEAG